MTGPRKPLASMTGSGTAAGATPLGELTVEVRSVNSRGLSIKQRLCSECQGLETAFEEVVRRRLQRGSVTVVAARSPGQPAAIDTENLREAARQASDMCAAMGLQPPTLRDVLAVLGPAGGGGGAKPTWQPPAEVTALLDKALDALVGHRRREGEAISAALSEHLEALRRQLDAARSRAPEVVADHRDKLLQRVNAFLEDAGRPLEPGEVVREVALFADRIDVTEELQRLDSHCEEMRALLERGGELGRKLEFLLQEMLREANTLGSKSPDVRLAHIVVEIKSRIDRLKEQVANLE